MINNELLKHINDIHTTKLGLERIKKNILAPQDVVGYIRSIILKKETKIYQKGKNYYCEIDNIRIAINSFNYCIITTHMIK